MYDKSGEIIYVGKSQDLHRRLHQHIGEDTHTAYFIKEVTKVRMDDRTGPCLPKLIRGDLHSLSQAEIQR